MKKCSCCEKEINQGIKKYAYIFCDECSIKIFDKLSLVESTINISMKEVQKEIK